MKGLLIKDFRLLLSQQKFFLTIAVIGILFTFLNNDPSFAIGYMTILFTFFTISTINYDEFDNGMAFLMTLPFKRKQYVQEKYLFGMIISAVAGMVSMLIAIFYVLGMQTGTQIKEVIVTTVIMIGVAILFLIFMIPLEIKFGVEKGRTAMFLVGGIIFLGVFLAGILIEQMNIDIEMFFARIMQKTQGILVLLAILILCVAGGISYFLSLRFMEKKEF